MSHNVEEVTLRGFTVLGVDPSLHATHALNSDHHAVGAFVVSPYRINNVAVLRLKPSGVLVTYLFLKTSARRHSAQLAINALVNWSACWRKQMSEAPVCRA